MDFELSAHAREVMEHRRIEVTWGARVVRSPERMHADRVVPDLEHHLARIPEFGNRVLRVIVSTRFDPPSVITAFFDRREVLE